MLLLFFCLTNRFHFAVRLFSYNGPRAVVSNPRNDGTRNGGTTERETAERDFFSVFFFFFFF